MYLNPIQFKKLTFSEKIKFLHQHGDHLLSAIINGCPVRVLCLGPFLVEVNYGEGSDDPLLFRTFPLDKSDPIYRQYISLGYL